MTQDPSEKAWRFICPHCEQGSNAIVRGKAIWDGVSPADENLDPPVEWTLVQCHRCSQPTMQAREDFGGGFSEDDRPATVYPPSHRLSTAIPAGLRRDGKKHRRALRRRHTPRASSWCDAPGRHVGRARHQRTQPRQGAEGQATPSLSCVITQSQPATNHARTALIRRSATAQIRPR
jgi:hypothetical protein